MAGEVAGGRDGVDGDDEGSVGATLLRVVTVE